MTRSYRKSFAVLALTSTLTQVTHALNNGLGLTPAMGWNSWNHYGCDINEQVIKSNA
jgi:alpha-galactosidase